MIGWKPKPFIFVHIPKCAGTSIEEAFIPIVTGHKRMQSLSEEQRSKFWLPGRKGLQHRKIRGYEQHFRLSHYFKFAFVRNPWDRAISQIDYLRTKAKATIFSNRDFKERLKAYCTTKKNIWGHDLNVCQLDYLKDNSGKVKIDFVGRFESLEKDFKEVCSIIGIEPILNLPHIFNSKRTTHYSEYYDEESAEWIQRRFEMDIDAFGYSFERPQPILSICHSLAILNGHSA
jgi:hypothetical protein